MYSLCRDGEVGRRWHVPLSQVDIGLLADQVGVATSNTLDLRQGVHDVLLAIDVGVQQPEDELEVRLLACHERCSIRSYRLVPVIPFYPSWGASFEKNVDGGGTYT